MDIQQNIQMRPLGDSAIVVQIGEGISPEIHHVIIHLTNEIERDPFHGFVEAVPSYNSITVYYNPVTIYFENQQSQVHSTFQKVSAFMQEYIDRVNPDKKREQRVIDIPVIYGGEYGPDLEIVATYNSLTTEEVIDLHVNNEYMVYMIGFSPGFPFLGGMDERISTPRKISPRQAIPQGSVGIAGKQTGIYSLETPGGWQIIGRSPASLFLPNSSPPTLLQAGDKIRFQQIEEEEFLAYKEEMT